jgi:GTP-binding protein
MDIALMAQGWASKSLPEAGQRPEGASVAPLLDAIVTNVPPPAGDPAAPFALLVAMVEHDSFVGPVATGRIAAGTVRAGDALKVLHHTGAFLTR